MVFDKFKKIRPDTKSKSEILADVKQTDSDYINSLITLKSASRNKALHVLLETAAAIVIVTVALLWALIGRGVNLKDSTDVGTNTEKSVYYAMADNMEIINGKDQIQAFFDDYMTGKACTLDIFRVEKIDENGIAEGTSYVYAMNEDGSGEFYYLAAKNGEYTAYEGARYINENYLYTSDKPLFIGMLRFALFDDGVSIFGKGTDIICPDNYGMDFPLDLSFLQNDYENSDRLYDYTKADVLRVENGVITEGKQELFDFLRLYNSGCAAFLKTEGDTPMFLERSSMSGGLQCFAETEQKHGLVLYMETDALKGTVKIQLKEEQVLGALYKEIVTLDFNEVYNNGLFFDSAHIEDGYAYLYGQLDEAVMMENTKELIQMLKADPPQFTDATLFEKDHDMLLYFSSGLKMYLYENENGEYDLTVGLRFPLYMSEHIQAVTLSEQVMTVIKDGLDSKTVTDGIHVTSSQGGEQQ